MKIRSRSRSGMTLVEISVTTGVVGVLGLIIYSLLNMGTILGAKNTATNTAHQQARVAMLEMVQDLHSAISLPAMTNATGTPYLVPPPGATPISAEGISFQQWSSGPHKITANVARDANVVTIALTAGQPVPLVGQRLIVATHQIEVDITAVSASGGNYNLTLAYDIGDTDQDGDLDGKGADGQPNGSDKVVEINGTNSTTGHVVCYITDRCSYRVVVDSVGPPIVYKLQWRKQSDPIARDIVTDITNPKPFSIPTTASGALYYRFVAAIDLSTSDPKYSNRGYKAANILLNGLVPYKTRLTTYQ